MRWGSRHLGALCLTFAVVAVGVPPTTSVNTARADNAPWTLPTVPPSCSTAQANSGDVAGCVIVGQSGAPEDRGWPNPPFPETTGGAFPPAGWRWNGASYNGSAALNGWESLFVGNRSQIGTVRPGQFNSFPDALPLYEGFLAEIQAMGYRIYNGTGAYSFRCTATTRKDCRNLTRSSLSRHAYGLASDINTTQNPLRTYFGINGASACLTPMQTDMPQWVVQVAEKWGLYWGGYGWSGGCSSPAQEKPSANRDPMHFEFNGSVAQARAILCHNLGFAPNFEVVDANGIIARRCFGPVVPTAGNRMVIHTNAPAGATAALVNLTGTSASGNGYFAAESCGPIPDGIRPSSNGNIRAGRDIAATAVVPLDTQGRFCLYQSVEMHSIVDVQGFFAPASSAPTGTLYTPVTPVRTLDTRQREFCSVDGTCRAVGPIPAGSEIRNVSTAPVNAAATVANLTIVQPTTPGYLTADDCTALVPGDPPHSNINFAPGDIVANLTLSPSAITVDGSEFCTYSQVSMNELIDVQGYFAPWAEGGLGYNSLVPTRLVDTRQCWTDAVTLVERCAQLNAGGEIIHMKAPVGAEAVLINLTTDGATFNGAYVSAGPCSVITAGIPEFSNVNAVIGTAVANAAIVPVDGDGTFCAYISHPTHLIVDLMGTFSTAGELRFLAVTPQRVHDSRSPG
ncbi:MAG: M15 family metallopeptidase [Actinobacteria bacterium]|nr:M15 family metallopeptidase [Actinomycetota bacterium]